MITRCKSKDNSELEERGWEDTDIGWETTNTNIVLTIFIYDLNNVSLMLIYSDFIDPFAYRASYSGLVSWAN